MPVRVTYLLKELADYRPFRIGGSGPDRATAVAEANAKLAMICGVVERATISDVPTAGETGEPNPGTSFSNADLILRNNTTGKTVSIRLDNVTTDIGTGVGGIIDIEDPLVVAFATAYRDGDGNGGYSPYGGEFER